MDSRKKDELRQAVRTHYGNVAESNNAGCGCAPDCCTAPVDNANLISQSLGYSLENVDTVPEGANMGLGCGNPQAIAALKADEVVLDLGSGGGFDCFLAAQQVGGKGEVIGVDMTPEMVSLARTNAAKGEYHNVEFRLGEIENLPIGNDSVDVILSNCVINLSPDKPGVFAEAYRVLKPGGRLAISDVVAINDLPEAIKKDLSLYSGCVAGASVASEIEMMLKTAGFTEIRVAPKDNSKSIISKWGSDSDVTDYVLTATIEAIKPQD